MFTALCIFFIVYYLCHRFYCILKYSGILSLLRPEKITNTGPLCKLYPTLWYIEYINPVGSLLSACGKEGNLNTVQRLVESGIINNDTLHAGLTVSSVCKQRDISIYLIKNGATPVCLKDLEAFYII